MWEVNGARESPGKSETECVCVRREIARYGCKDGCSRARA